MAGPSTPSEPDYYDLLGISPVATESEIRRAYRKTSILYHPDKVEPTPANLDKFHLLQIALNVLTTPDEKTKYDQTREAKLRRAAEHAKLEANRQRLKEDLEQAEAAAATSGVSVGMGRAPKRSWTEREVKIANIKEENRRRMAEIKARRAQDAEEARGRLERDQREREEKEEKERREQNGDRDDDADGGNEAMDRSVKLRWVKEGEGLEIDQDSIQDEFAVGEVESVVMLKDKRRRLEGRKEKATMGTAVVVFATLAAARKAVRRGPWDGIESVNWAKEKEAPT
ncbi:uncharacterized protein HMPREF1541_04169 [Cyphellophora europaea CBS 101466]|uniref:J domain-containing protein n=1 Tax=Cyphellophora europaea (strain CBS 101466) TaxID=1220924 RepID=W2S2E6_CYPE1|nr:uncharacterized protein HMPREF1541_04169 [Cyphellophora europaea CBS 101466]ETN42228.1 hypothetical protein HMPREF1541_04169 [Cyphellophora europaea CBS 101466]